VKMEHHISWMKSACWISAAHLPAISVPAGVHIEWAARGIQMVGRYRADLEVLRIAHPVEQATGIGRQRPKIAG
jgi:amidase